MSMRIGRLGAAIAALALVAAACGGAGGQQPGGALSGQVRIDGSSTVFPISEAMAEEFQIANPGVRITVGISGTGGGFKKFCAGETDISDASRPISETEAAECDANGVEYVELQAAIDGLSVVVNPANDWADCLTVSELRRIWDTGSTVDNWREVRAEFPDAPLPLFGAGTDSGTFDYFTDAINGEEKRSRADFTASEDDNVLVQGVAGNRNALGFFGYAYYQENRDKLKVLAIDNEEGAGCVEPNPETIEAYTYAPLSRPIYIYPRVDALARPEVAEFVRFYLDSANRDLISEVGYIPAPDGTYQEGLALVEAALR
ncbi:MAG TPA: PstS family phosphate ABC transporter substrate-binding protein [Candidatus Limnocylindrales bacterium]|nr:PstS family phosphate ABC transporter substrate-binding protein [Candidatus Limnocylindrales bacterium]